MPKKLNLWTQGTPLAKGDDPHDIPSITVYSPTKNSRGAAVLICPGGGYKHLALEHEGRELAEWLNELGITGVVLEYRMGLGGYRHPVPLMDVKRAMRVIRHGSEEYGIDPDKVGVIGFSAGGHLASTLGVYHDSGSSDDKDLVERQSCRPDFMVLCYPVIAMGESFTHQGSQKNLLGDDPDDALVRSLSIEKNIHGNVPPTFLFHSADDITVPIENSLSLYRALLQAEVPSELRIYYRGGHGTGLARREEHRCVSEWSESCERWFMEKGIL